MTTQPLPRFHPRQLLDETRLLSLRLSELPAHPDLEQAWTLYRAVLEKVVIRDSQVLGAIEAEIEEGATFPADSRPNLRSSPPLFSERLGDDLRDAWARLRARQLVAILKGDGTSLRGITDEVHVSTPYLSQLANGTGPVPSDRILEKLAGGVRRRDVGPERSIEPPEAALSPLVDRARSMRQQIKLLAAQRPAPQVTIDGLPARETRRLAPLFNSLVERCLDDNEGKTMYALLEALAAADPEQREVFAMVNDDVDIRDVVIALANLDDKGKRGLVALLQSRASEMVRDRVMEPRGTKQPLQGREDG